MRGERLEMGEKILTYHDLEVYRVSYRLALEVINSKFTERRKIRTRKPIASSCNIHTSQYS
jgi:hypothetical protein